MCQDDMILDHNHFNHHHCVHQDASVTLSWKFLPDYIMQITGQFKAKAVHSAALQGAGFYTPFVTKNNTARLQVHE